MQLKTAVSLMRELPGKQWLTGATSPLEKDYRFS
jgi:hypothetical protein